MLNRESSVLVTGGTGLIGGEIIRGLLRRQVKSVGALVRPMSHMDATARLRDRIVRSDRAHSHQDHGPHRLLPRGGHRTEPHILADSPTALEAIVGDVTLPRWGLSPDDFARVAGCVEIIVHGAAETSFNRDRACHEVNVRGTENLIDFARHCSKDPLIVYFSTACNVGKVKHRCLLETEGCRPDNKHHNEYTHSKAIAEQMLRDSGLPVLVLRPSIVLSEGIPDSRFARAILWFVPLVNEFECMPLDATARLDVVPVTFVVESTLRLLALPKLRYDCYNLSAGKNHSATLQELTAFCDRYFDRPVPLHLVPPDDWTEESYGKYVQTEHQQRLFFALQYYLPFVNMDVVFDNTRLKNELDGTLTIPRLPEYLGELLSIITPEDALAESARP